MAATRLVSLPRAATQSTHSLATHSRTAHLSASAVASTSSSQLPPLSPSPAYSTSHSPATGSATAEPGSGSHHEAWSDPSYLSRYRNPSALEGPSGVKQPARTRQLGGAVDSGSSPRARRLEMERMWSGGDPTPEIPTHHYRSFPSRTPAPRKHALLLPGIGAAYVGMASFLDGYPPAGAVWAEAQDALDGFEDWRRSLKLDEREGELGELGRMLAASEGERQRHKGLRRSVFEGPQDELILPAISQPAILVTSIAFLRTLEQHFAAPVAKQAAAIIGHSSGEYAAAVAAESLSLHSATRLTRLHGLLTTAALSLPSINLNASSPDDPRRAQMSALVIKPGHSHEEAAELIGLYNAGRKAAKGCEGWVEVASYNSAGQIVLAGSREGIQSASEILRDLDIASHAADLPISAPFHCSFLQPTAQGIAAALAHSSISLADPVAPLLSSLDGAQLTSGEDVADALVEQITAPVQWSQALASLGARFGVERLLFLGPGKALANLAKRDLGLRAKANTESGFPSRRQGDQSAVQQTAYPTKDDQLVRTEVISVATESDLGQVADFWADEHPEQPEQPEQRTQL